MNFKSRNVFSPTTGADKSMPEQISNPEMCHKANYMLFYPSPNMTHAQAKPGAHMQELVT